MTIKEAYNKHYKILLIIPLVLLAISLIYLYTFYQANGDFIKKDVSLTGGTTITVYSQETIDLNDLESYLNDNLEDFAIREITTLTSGRQEAVIIESSEDSDVLKQVLENYFGYGLTLENSSIEFTGSFLSEEFYSQLIRAIIFAFILMAIVVFVIFRTLVPSSAVILSAFADIIMTLALVDYLGIKMSSAGIVAFLMLIGYSVDTDIMLTTKLLKQREGDLGDRLLASFKTGLTMTLTSLVAVLVALTFTASFSPVLKQIFTVLAIGLSFDILNTWITNVSILRMYVEKKDRRHE